MTYFLLQYTHMRKSIATRQAQAHYNVMRVRVRHQRIAMWLGVVLLASACGLFLSYTNWSATNQINQSNKSIAQSQQQAKQYIALAKINAKKKVESDAKAQTAAQMAATGKSEADLIAAWPAAPASTTASCGVSDPSSLTVIINKKHCFTPLNWTPPDLTTIDGHQMRNIAATHMTAMMQAAATANAGFSITSGYRSYQDQLVVYNEWVRINGSTALADSVSARPGYSEHQTGLAADLETPGCVLECFGKTPAYAWLAQHAADYGFIRRYPDGLSSITGYAPEPWHWRYVGATVAKDMKAKGIQTLEAYYGVSGGNY